LVFINDIPLANENSQIISHSALYADDLAALFVFKNVSDSLKRKLQAYLQNLVAWLFKWRLKMNASKC
jgi:hypothetical protein